MVPGGAVSDGLYVDEAKHPGTPSSETVEKLQESVAKVDEFKVRTSEYVTVKGQLNVL